MLLWVTPLANGAPEVSLVEIAGVPVADINAVVAAQSPLDQESLLRLVNRIAREAAVVIEAVDLHCA